MRIWHIEGEETDAESVFSFFRFRYANYKKGYVMVNFR